MENNIEQTNVKDLTNPQDSLNAALIFARALSFIFQDNQGIVVDVKNDIQLGDDAKKVIVFKHQDQIHIYKCEDELEEGTTVMMSESTSDTEQKN